MWKVARLKPVGGFRSESAAAASIYFASFLGVPVRKIQIITGSVMGAGSLRRLNAAGRGAAGWIVWT